MRFDLRLSICEESDELCNELQQARINTFSQHQLDKMRMEKLLLPIFTTEHRIKIKQRNLLLS